jgi:serine/threonine protein kinase
VSQYAAPENLGPADGRPEYKISADVWAIGQILVEAITGHFKGPIDGEPWYVLFSLTCLVD